MRNIGFHMPLYILPFDDRASFQTQMFGWQGALTPEQIADISFTKQVIYEGFKAAIAWGVPKDKAGVLVDEQFGAAILHDAAASGYVTACSVERAGVEEFSFEYGEEFDRHIEALHPTYCKALVRYNPEGDKALNVRQAVRLRRLSDYLRGKSQSLFMFELLVPPIRAQLERVAGDKRAYDWALRPRLTAQAIEQLQDAQVEADVWMIEGLDRREDYEKIVVAARRDGREDVGCIILDRGDDDLKVQRWLATAALVPGVIGFAAGRTSFWEPLLNWRRGQITRHEAVAAIAYRYRKLVNAYEGKVYAAA